MATFDELVLEISQSEVAESLHAKFYLYEINFLPSGVSVHTLSVEDTPEESICFGTMIFMNWAWRCLLLAPNQDYFHKLAC